MLQKIWYWNNHQWKRPPTFHPGWSTEKSPYDNDIEHTSRSRNNKCPDRIQHVKIFNQQIGRDQPPLKNMEISKNHIITDFPASPLRANG